MHQIQCRGRSVTHRAPVIKKSVSNFSTEHENDSKMSRKLLLRKEILKNHQNQWSQPCRRSASSNPFHTNRYVFDIYVARSLHFCNCFGHVFERKTNSKPGMSFSFQRTLPACKVCSPQQPIFYTSELIFYTKKLTFYTNELNFYTTARDFTPFTPLDQLLQTLYRGARLGRKAHP